MTYAKEQPVEPGWIFVKHRTANGGYGEPVPSLMTPKFNLMTCYEDGDCCTSSIAELMQYETLFGPRVIPPSAQPASPAMGETPFDQLSELTLQFLLYRTDFSFGWMGIIGGQLAHDVQRELQASLDRKRLSTLPGGKP